MNYRGTSLSSSIRYLPHVALAAAASVLTSCNGGEVVADVGNAPERHLIDERAATYRGIGIGDSRGDIVGTFGEPSGRLNDPIAPLGRDFTLVNMATRFNCQSRGPQNRDETLRYQWVTFFRARSSVCGFIVIKDGAATNRGVAIGDPLVAAEKAYPEIECGTGELGDRPITFPFCAGNLGDHRHIWFGGDPIDTIQMNRRQYGDVRGLRREARPEG